MMGNRHRGRLANRDFTDRWSRGYRFIARSRGKVKRAMRRNVRRSAKQSRYVERERGFSPVEPSPGELMELLYEN